MKQFLHYSPLPVRFACLTQPAKTQAYTKKTAGQGLFFTDSTGQKFYTLGQLQPSVFPTQNSNGTLQSFTGVTAH